MRVLVSALIVLLAACSGAVADSPADESSSTTTTTTSAVPLPTIAPQSAFAEKVAAWQAAHDVVGAVVVVVDSTGAEEAIAVGFNDRQSEEAMEPTDRFRIGSITKIYTAALVLSMAEDQLLSLADSASQQVPNLPEAITLGQLLSHTSGLRDADVAAGIFEAIEAGGIPEGSGDPLADALDRGLVFEPGSRQSYSSIGYLAVERVIEGVLGRPWTDALRERILREGADTQLEDASTQLPTPYERFGSSSPAISLAGLPTSEFARGAGAAGGLVASASAVAQFIRDLFAGEIISAESLAVMTDFTAPRTDYGVGLAAYDVGANRVFGHNGRTIGFASSVRHDATAGVTVVVLSNDGAAPTDELAESLILMAVGTT